MNCLLPKSSFQYLLGFNQLLHAYDEWDARAVSLEHRKYRDKTPEATLAKLTGGEDLSCGTAGQRRHAVKLENKIRLGVFERKEIFRR